jgi:hypothetical protein
MEIDIIHMRRRKRIKKNFPFFKFLTSWFFLSIMERKIRNKKGKRKKRKGYGGR